ncbi:MAG: serine/threonine protein kinase, partial [Calditrichaeota bacterium]|nr:serine/threonine protein kinase [Calditrichota bacterium]
MDDVTKQILFDKFEILSCVKQDESTGVYIARHIYLGKNIFLKTLDQDKIADEAVLKRFKREAKVLARLDHPNIIKVFDFGTHGHFFYISFEYFESSDLRKIMQQGSLTDERKTDILIHILKGLDYSHQNKIVHRDLKPENILIDTKGQVKIADFGLAQGVNESRLTNKSSIVGTPGYMSPEQILGEKLTSQSDLFSLGVIAYELFVGKNPFLGSDVGATINNILTFDESRIPASLANTPAPWNEIIVGLLKRSKKERIGSAGEILKRLGKKESQAAEPIKVEKTKGWKFKAAAVFALAAVILVIFISRPRHTSEIANIEKPLQQIPDTSAVDSTSKNILLQTSVGVKMAEKPSGNLPEKLIPSPPQGNITAKKNPNIPGKLFVRCSPWAEIFIDSVKIDTTPLSDTLRVAAGLRQLILKHPDYPAYIRKIVIEPMRTKVVTVNLDTLFGFLNCKIYPWGEIFIDGKTQGQSPFPRPICLEPGRHLIKVKNPQYQEVVEYIQINRRDTTEYELDFE